MFMLSLLCEELRKYAATVTVHCSETIVSISFSSLEHAVCLIRARRVN